MQDVNWTYKDVHKSSRTSSERRYVGPINILRPEAKMKSEKKWTLKHYAFVKFVIHENYGVFKIFHSKLTNKYLPHLELDS